jgi:hypothetical protein
LALKNTAEKIVNGCIGRFGYDFDVCIPDAEGAYPGFWHRDFGYMLEYTGEFFNPDMVKYNIELILENARLSDGWLPDRYMQDGSTFFSAGMPGSPCGHDCLDTITVMIRTFNCYLNMVDQKTAKEFYLKWRTILIRALDAMPIDAVGLVYNSPSDPHTVFGFTDTVCKTGLLCIESIDMWRAYNIIDKLDKQFNLPTKNYTDIIKKIESAFLPTFLRDDGMLNSATIDCKQLDIWASAYSVAIGFPMPDYVKMSIAEWLARNYDSVSMFGYIRHTPLGEHWQRFHDGFEPKPGEYMNGAYWSFPSGWYAEAVYERYPDLSLRIFSEIAEFSVNDGVYECINDRYRKAKSYGVSVANVYGSAKKLLNK